MQKCLLTKTIICDTFGFSLANSSDTSVTALLYWQYIKLQNPIHWIAGTITLAEKRKESKIEKKKEKKRKKEEEHLATTYNNNIFIAHLCVYGCLLSKLN